MICTQRFLVGGLSLVFSLALTLNASAIELTTNGDFETGDTSGWAIFLGGGTQTFAATGDSNNGAFAGELFNADPGTPAVVKQANLGIGLVSPGDEVTISFSAKGSGEAGGVQFAEFFTELDGEGTSSSQILGGAPLFPPSDVYQDYSFTVFVGPDAGGGITLQFNAATGANPGSTSTLFIDDVSVSVIPEPGTLALLSLSGLALTAIRRRV